MGSALLDAILHSYPAASTQVECAAPRPRFRLPCFHRPPTDWTVVQRALTPPYIQPYVLGERFEWDESKSEENLRLRGFDFLFASLVFKEWTVEGQDDRYDYGENRVVAIGLANLAYLTVVYTDRVTSTGNRVRRILSARKSNRKERRIYEQVIHET